MIAAIENGMRKSVAARTCGVSSTSIDRWLVKRGSGSTWARKLKPRARKKQARLPGWQAATLVNRITVRCPDQLKGPFALWTREAVGQLLGKRLDVHVSVWTIGRYLRDGGLTPQKPLRRAYEQSPEAVNRWLKSQYPAIRSRATTESADIHWEDEMGARCDRQVSRYSAHRGQIPVAPGAGQRRGCNLISTITNRGGFASMVFTGRCIAPMIIKFLDRPVRHLKRMVFLALDRHPVQRTSKLQRRVADRADQNELFYLPDYSPELNPDEHPSQDVQANAAGRRHATDQEDWVANIRGYL